LLDRRELEMKMESAMNDEPVPFDLFFVSSPLPTKGCVGVDTIHPCHAMSCHPNRNSRRMEDSMMMMIVS
jgi:hypothetical protein